MTSLEKSKIKNHKRPIRIIKLRGEPLDNMTKIGAEVLLMEMNDMIKFNLHGMKYTIWRMVEK